MEIHYSKHHAAYIKNANKALEGHPALASMTAEEILVNLPRSTSRCARRCATTSAAT
jgi:Fe-Mn family superoxide dismutase